jgi:4-hydroxy-tetrahydrodipicolinate reductase
VIRVGVIGHSGRMGTAVCSAVEADPETELVAKIGRGDDLGGLADGGVEVAVDFTTPDSVVNNVRWCVLHDMDVVVGTSGLSDGDIDEIERLTKERERSVVVAPNFALGAVLMMVFASQAARFYDYCEILERHHEKKVDAPSGTALRTAELVARSHSGAWPERNENESIPGSRGGDAGGVRIHSLRAPGSVAHQEVLFGGLGETLTIRHDSIDRASFMPGVMLAIKRVRGLPGVTIGLEHLLNLED